MKPLPGATVAIAVSGAGGALIALALVRAQASWVSMGIAAGIVTALFFRCPWAVLPVSIIGGSLTGAWLGAASVAQLVAVHAAFLGAGLLALAMRRAADPSWGARVKTACDVPMMALAVGLGVGAVYGLARGNPPDAVLVAAYEIAVIPAYFFIATLTLSSPRRLRAAGLLYVAAAAAYAIGSLTISGQHGGLFSALALPAALVAASSVRGGRRIGLLSLAGLFSLDILLSSYRAIWLASVVALAVIASRRSLRLRGVMAGGLATAAVVGIVAVALSGGVRSRTELVGSALHRDGGYRLSEARVGMEAFLDEPLAGRGLGQVERRVFLPGFRVNDVGPVYHVFYVMLLANGGLVGLALLVWPLAVAALRRGRGTLPYRAMLAGFVAAAAFAGPTDGHWELGVLPALIMLTDRFASTWTRPIPIGSPS